MVHCSSFFYRFDRLYEEDAEILRRFKAYEKHMQEVAALNRLVAERLSVWAKGGEANLQGWSSERLLMSIFELLWSTLTSS